MIFKKIVTSTLILLSLLGIGSVFASPLSYAATKDTVQSGVDAAGGTGTTNDKDALTKTIKSVIGILLFIIGMVAVIFIIIAGFRFVTSNGDSNTISSARNTIIYAILGIVVAVMAYAIVNFVIDNIT